MLTLNVLGAAERVIVPLQPEYYALEGITYLMATIDRVREVAEPGSHRRRHRAHDVGPA